MGDELVIVAIGSNLGDSAGLAQQAMDRLQSLSDSPLRRSSLWKTPPVDCPPGSPDFVNAAVAFCPRPNETPETLLGKLQAIEKEFGRQTKEIHNEPRPLDLDLIAFGERRELTADLTLPHPRAHERAFVLQPLSEIAQDFVLPGQSKTVAELVERLQAAGALFGLERL